ncbi:MAG: hypothetical protein UR56_C0003G0059 [Candidatus Roizmanbacteria bacterium GW2011_GWC2_34_23]|uniref:Uncharacterized protein n=1 Tax=Candidatus Roizmanbacteria bacterium GW2011_GWC2_34_23 TaxID=1618484 RepID=A0A0G0E6H2_9BACT|nr:MAG: hypothetical protein UR15_C0032G0011 [Parcubacteria group bacterium GW2011_GWA2_31_28]KKP62952.1 MAG: hypothetical protein UR56_C0003G0059 [Candidatus Roizmanbacteria bacterium GW2011_GWC2_34_23]
MKIHLNSRFPKRFVLTNFKNVILLLFVCLSIYGCYLVQTLKKNTEILNQSINKINKELTPKPTVKPTITPTPTPEYIFIAMPNSGVVLSCKRNSQQALIQVSSVLASANKKLRDCFLSHLDECNKGCKKNDIKCKSQCSSNADNSCSNEVNENDTDDTLNTFNKLIKENCLGNNQ